MVLMFPAPLPLKHPHVEHYKVFPARVQVPLVQGAHLKPGRSCGRSAFSDEVFYKYIIRHSMRYSRGQSTRHSIGYSVWSTPLATPWPCCVPSKMLLASSWLQPCVHPLAGSACPLSLYLDNIARKWKLWRL